MTLHFLPRLVRTLRSLVMGRRTGRLRQTAKGATWILCPARVIAFAVSTSSTSHVLQGCERKRARWPPYAPFCSDGIGLSVLPGASRLLGLAPVGCRRLTRSRINVTVGRIILDAGCVVSAPLPALSGPPLARGHHSEGGGTFLSDPERPPSAVRGLLAGRAHPTAPIWTLLATVGRSRLPGGKARGPFIHPVFACLFMPSCIVLQRRVGAREPAGRWRIRCFRLLGSDGARASIR